MRVYSVQGAKAAGTGLSFATPNCSIAIPLALCKIHQVPPQSTAASVLPSPA